MREHETNCFTKSVLHSNNLAMAHRQFHVNLRAMVYCRMIVLKMVLASDMAKDASVHQAVAC